ncbi:hypothetical protein BCR34DRAFT_45185 [Clohesyomyces aquaticus]|uniref:Large ribosomal subunit protein bL33m n=1 Tax=Clohesyomyces aquaticus TaxID=1231657 RepID=A0A1Y1Z516_9PLEO|nr:hypothetical protein BCR34DRAFT_45185 [Clohesyomyces aquaticus]
MRASIRLHRVVSSKARSRNHTSFHHIASRPAPMAKKAKSRTIMVRLISMAMTGYYRTLMRPRAHRPLSMLKYDPIVRKQVLFLEAKRGKR